ncbi:MAG: glycosyltransferase family 2 protein [Rhodobacteraceae bacterium]|jgi:NDP-sugar pyrophosphorylase family protein|nr:glycosyltransferase family 2 protein [Paracoccaceae bacterium]
MKILIPMGGSDEAFRQHGYAYAKPLVEIAGRPLVQHAFDPLRQFADARAIFVIRKEDDLRFHLGDVLRLLDPPATVIRADGPTAGAACTALLAIEHIDNDDELLIANGDQILAFDVETTVARFRARGLDAATVVFDSVHPRWSFVKTDADDMVIEAAEKRPISRNATAGVYYFRQGRLFVEAAKAMIRKGASVNGGFFVCPSLNELVLAQKRVGVERIERAQYISLATPQAVEEYEQMLKARV